MLPSGRMAAAAGAMACGVMRSACREALDYSRKRKQGGKAIAQYWEVRMILAEMTFKLDIAETLVYQASRAADDRLDGWNKNCRAAALYSQELACTLTSDGIQLLGGYGYMKDFGQEKYFRDAQQINALLGLSPMRKLHYLEDYLSVELKGNGFL